MGKNKLLTAIIVGVVIIAGAYLALRSYRPAPQPQTANQTPLVEKSQPSLTEENSPTETTSQNENLVEITAAGFSPELITIKAGQAVTWINKDKFSHQVASALHPTHLVYPPLNTIGLLTSGESKPLTFPQAGTFKYHDHLNPDFTGEVIVE